MKKAAEPSKRTDVTDFERTLTVLQIVTICICNYNRAQNTKELNSCVVFMLIFHDSNPGEQKQPQPITSCELQTRANRLQLVVKNDSVDMM